MSRRSQFYAGIIFRNQQIELRLESDAGDVLGERKLSLPTEPLESKIFWALICGVLEELIVPRSTGGLPLEKIHVALGFDLRHPSQYRKSLLAESPGFCSLESASNFHMTLLGAHAGEPGLLLSINSRVVAQSFDASRLSHRMGGWGFPFDVGGTAWLGWMALSQSLALLDGRNTDDFSDSLLHQSVLDFCGSNPEKIREWLDQADTSAYEALSKMVIEFAHKQDTAASRLVLHAVEEIGKLLLALDKDQVLPLSLCGDQAPEIKPFLPDWLKKWVVEPKGPATQGAILLAREPDLREICTEPQLSWKVQSASKLRSSVDALRPDLNSSTPLYIQLKNRFVQAIQNGLWCPGNALPSERYLSEALEVSRITIRKTLELLLEEGFIERQQGAGTFVKQRIEQPISILTGFSEEMRARGLVPSTQVLERFVRPASPEESLILNLKPGQKVSFLKRLRLADNRPIAVEYTVLPHQVLPNPQMMKESLYSYLKEQRCMPVRALQHLRANIVSSTERDLLEATDDTPVLYITRIGYLAGGKPIEYTRSYYRGDRYDFIAELQTDSPADSAQNSGKGH